MFGSLATKTRNRRWYLVALIVVIAAGLASRRYAWLFPACLGKYPGDALWALMVFGAQQWAISSWDPASPGLTWWRIRLVLPWESLLLSPLLAIIVPIEDLIYSPSDTPKGLSRGFVFGGTAGRVGDA